jgi:hypothetical protein
MGTRARLPSKGKHEAPGIAVAVPSVRKHLNPKAQVARLPFRSPPPMPRARLPPRAPPAAGCRTP